jgi:hypothetical protein
MKGKRRQARPACRQAQAMFSIFVETALEAVLEL